MGFPPDLPADLDLGHGHTLRWVAWSPDRVLNPQYADLPDVRWGATVNHPGETPTGVCPGGFITFEQPPAFDRLTMGRPTWKVESWEPLTMSPSLACRVCGDHGWIKGGLWVPA